MQLARKTPSILLNSDAKPQFFAREDHFKANQQREHLTLIDKPIRDKENGRNWQEGGADEYALLPRGAEELLLR